MLSAVLITAALVLYSIGVWSEHLQRRLKGWHIALFAAGLACDATGTMVMMSRVGESTGSGVAGWLMIVMMVTGGLALLLMATARWRLLGGRFTACADAPLPGRPPTAAGPCASFPAHCPPVHRICAEAPGPRFSPRTGERR